MAINQLEQSVRDYNQARKKTPHINQNEAKYQELKTYCEYLKIEMPDGVDELRLMLIPEVPGILLKEEARRLELIEQRPAKDALNIELQKEADQRNEELDAASTDINQDKEQAWMCSGKVTKETPESIKRWRVRNGKLSQYVPSMQDRGYYGRNNFSMVRLRIVDSKVETSQSANVPVESAKRLWGIMKTKAQLIGEKCGSYTVINWNGKLKIGCHEIEKEEIKRFILYYEWDNEQTVFETLGL